jgi:ketosteroid isomerase-like protein
VSQENVEIVRRAYELVEEGDWSGNLRFLSPDVVYRPLAMFTETHEVRGRDAYRRFIDSFMEAWSDDFTIRPVTRRDYGDAVIARLQYTGHARASGIEISERMFSVYWLQDGKITRIEDFVQRHEALEAVGLRE